MNKTAIKTTASLALAAGLLLGSAGIADARGGGAIGTAGRCSAASTWTLKAKPDNGRIEVELEVDQNRNGVRWDVVFGDNGWRVFTGSAVTAAPSGSFTVRRIIPNRAGVDHIVGKATNPATGEVCRGTVDL